jgi:hypothetical protein
LIGLEGIVEQNRDPVCGSLAWQALGVQPCRVNIVQCCANFGGMAGKAEIMQGWGAWPSETELLQGCAGLWSLDVKAEIVQGWGAWPRDTGLVMQHLLLF